MTLLKAIAGVCLGFALFSALQAVGEDALKNLLPTYGPIDTREGQRLAIESAARRIDMQIRNAQSYVPVPGRFGR